MRKNWKRLKLELNLLLIWSGALGHRYSLQELHAPAEDYRHRIVKYISLICFRCREIRHLIPYKIIHLHNNLVTCQHFLRALELLYWLTVNFLRTRKTPFKEHPVTRTIEIEQTKILLHLFLVLREKALQPD